MTLYYFKLNDAADPVGSEHATLETVRAEAIGTMDDIRCDKTLTANDESHWKLVVTDQEDTTVMTLTVDVKITT